MRTVPARPDPLSGPAAGQSVGVLGVEFAIRRRMRVNGTLTAVGPDDLTIDAEQAFGNCPSCIQQRALEPAAGVAPASRATEGKALTPGQQALVRAADTFFLGTAHPARGADASRKGGRPGFVRGEGQDLWWPHYAGNNLFNSLGNIAVNPETALRSSTSRRGRRCS